MESVAGISRTLYLLCCHHDPVLDKQKIMYGLKTRYLTSMAKVHLVYVHYYEQIILPQSQVQGAKWVKFCPVMLHRCLGININVIEMFPFPLLRLHC